MSAPIIRTPLPGPKAKAIIDRDSTVVSPSYTRGYPLVIERGSGCMWLTWRSRVSRCEQFSVSHDDTANGWIRRTRRERSAAFGQRKTHPVFVVGRHPNVHSVFSGERRVQQDELRDVCIVRL